MRTAPVGSGSDYRAENRTTKRPESLCRRSALPPSGRRGSSPARTLLPGHRSYRLMRRSRSTLLSSGLSLVRGVSAGCYQPLLPAGPSRPTLGLWMVRFASWPPSEPIARLFCSLPVLPLSHAESPNASTVPYSLESQLTWLTPGLWVDALYDAEQGRFSQNIASFVKDSEQSRSDTLVQIVDGTGGRYYKNSNDLGSALDESALSSEPSYLLAFSPEKIKERWQFSSN